MEREGGVVAERAHAGRGVRLGEGEGWGRGAARRVVRGRGESSG